jgi:hypothetical protein
MSSNKLPSAVLQHVLGLHLHLLVCAWHWLLLSRQYCGYCLRL